MTLSPVPTMPWAWTVRRKSHPPATPVRRNCTYGGVLCWLPITTNLEASNNAQLVRTHSCPGSGVQARLSSQGCDQSVGWPGFSLEVLKQNPSRLTKVIDRIQFQVGGCRSGVLIPLLAVIWGPLSVPRGCCHPRSFSHSFPLQVQTSFKSL